MMKSLLLAIWIASAGAVAAQDYVVSVPMVRVPDKPDLRVPNYAGAIKTIIDNFSAGMHVRCYREWQRAVETLIWDERRRVSRPTEYNIGANKGACDRPWLAPASEPSLSRADTIVIRVTIHPILQLSNGREY